MRTDLKDIREQNGLSQQGLAEKAGVSVSMVSQVESGRRDAQKLSPRIAAKLATGYGITIDQLRNPVTAESAVPSR